MSTLLTLQQQASMTKDMYVVALKKYKEEETVHDKIYQVDTESDGMGNKMTDLLGPGRFKKHTVENEESDTENPPQGWPKLTKFEEFSHKMNFSKWLVERNPKFDNILKTIAGEYGFTYRVEKEIYGALAFNEGGALAGNDLFNGTYLDGTETDSSGDLMYDSFPLFNLTGNARSTKGGETYYNSVAGLTLTADNFEDMFVLMTNTNNRNERDQIISTKPDTLLTDAGNDMFMARRILQATNLPGGQLNDPNVYSNIVTPIAWPYLTDSAFYLMKKQTDQMQFINAEPLVMDFWRNNDNKSYSVDARFMIGAWFKDWRVAVRGGGTST